MEEVLETFLNFLVNHPDGKLKLFQKLICDPIIQAAYKISKREEPPVDDNLLSDFVVVSNRNHQNHHPNESQESQAGPSTADNNIEGLDEEEMVQIAMALSLVEQSNSDSTPSHKQTKAWNTLTKCKICWETIEIKDLIAAADCYHSFCQECIIRHLTVCINDGIDRFKCPEEGCLQAIPQELVEDLLPDETLQSLENLLFRKAIASFNEVHDCPHCRSPIECDITIGLGECPHCQFFFCTSCMSTYHGNYDCRLTDEERRKLIEAYKKNQEEEARRVLEEARRRREMEDQISNAFIKKNFKQCPHCRSDIEKIEGCNHMTCKCGAHFCWLCLVQLDPKDPYRHFRNNNTGCVSLSDVIDD